MARCGIYTPTRAEERELERLSLDVDLAEIEARERDADAGYDGLPWS